MTSSAIAALAKFAVSAQPISRLESVIAPAVADCFGCMLAGAQSEVANRVCGALDPLGSGGAPAYGTESMLPVPHAALANAVAGHAWDLDDWEEPGNSHPTVVLLSALLAAASLRPASGSDMLVAYSVGSEIIMRLGEAMSLDHYTRGFHTTATLGVLGATGAAGRLLHLQEGQLAHALAIAVSQAIGYTLQFGSNVKPLQAGFAARAGLECALFAEHGATGMPSVLDHQRGFAGLLGDFSQERFARMKSRLGNPWALDEYGLLLKPWPCCSYTHRLMTAALELRPKLASRLDSITSIHAVLPDFHLAVLPFLNPTTSGEALFSIPACIAHALATGGLTLADSEARFWEEPETASLMERVKVTGVPAINPVLNYDPAQPDELRVALDNGEELAAHCGHPLGAPQNPMSAEQLGEKYHSITGRPAVEYQSLLSWVEATDAAQFFAEAAR